MASVSVLYIDDEVVGPHLELLRNVCEPESTSRPHITVRYFERLPVPKDHLRVAVKHIDLIEPSSFGLEESDPDSNRTVYIRCKSDDLATLEHKPHYPASEFHITVYDGKSAKFAKSLLEILKNFEWGFRVLLPDDATLTRIQIKPRRSNRIQIDREYRTILKKIFYNVTTEHLSWALLVNLSDERRLELTRAICDHLNQATAGFLRISSHNVHGIHDTEGESETEETDIHLTPPELAADIAEYAVSLLDSADFPVHFGDPAVGTGAFYAALLQVVSNRELVASAIGIDISAQQVAAARWRWSDRGMKVMRGDYLHMERLSPRTLILANPPYLRHQSIPSNYKQDLRERASVNMGMQVSARSGLYVYFLLLSHGWMAPDAVAAWLIPSEFMQTAYGIAVRHYLTKRVQLIRIHQFGHDDPQFENARVLPAVAVFRNRRPSPEHTVLLSAGGTLKDPALTELAQVNTLRHEDKWSIPRRATIKHHSSELRIRDLFIVRRGIATGANKYFILERTAAARLGIPPEALRPILPQARALKADIIEREEDGYPRLSPQLSLLDFDLSEEEIKIRYPRLMEYLASAERDILERNLVRHRQPWYKQERREPPPFLCTYMGRSREGAPPLRFIWNKSDAVATNTYIMLYPRTALAAQLRQPGIASELFAVLQETARETMRDSWRIHAGGLHKIEPGELLEVHLSASPKWLTEGVEPDIYLRSE